MPNFTSIKRISFINKSIRILLFSNFRRSRYGVEGKGEEETCPSLPLKCDPESKIRTYDGTCNNLQYPEWGAMSKPYKRFFRPMYEDGTFQKIN